jgi:hypothetical protein
MSRRTFLAAALAATGLGGVGAYVAYGPEAGRPIRKLPAPRESDILRRSFGVNTHLTRTESPYAGAPDAGRAVVALMQRLGASYWREKAAVEDPLQRAGANELAAIGCRQVATIGELGDSPGSVAATVQKLAQAYGTEVSSVVAAIAGVNEPNAAAEQWIRPSVTHQRTIFEQARRISSLDDVAVLASAVQGNLQTAVMAMRALASTDDQRWADFGNMHHYTAGQEPTLGLDERLSAARAVVDGRQAWCTEIGYVDWLGHGPGNPVPPAVYAAYMPTALLEMVRRGVPAMIKYELLDQSDRSDTWEGHFGLVKCPSNDPDSWVEKPAFWALQQLIDVTTDRGPAFPIKRLEGTVAGEVSTMVLAKRDGSYVVLLWRDVSLYDVSNKQLTPVAAIPVTLALVHRHPLSWGAVDSPNRSRPLVRSELSIPVAGSVVAVTVGQSTT